MEKGKGRGMVQRGSGTQGEGLVVWMIFSTYVVVFTVFVCLCRILCTSKIVNAYVL